MGEAAPNQGKGDTSSLHLRIASQTLGNEGLPDPLPERLRRIAYDGLGEDVAGGGLSVRRQDPETVRITHATGALREQMAYACVHSLEPKAFVLGHERTRSGVVASCDVASTEAVVVFCWGGWRDVMLDPQHWSDNC